MIETTGARAWLIRHGESESNAGLPTNGPGAAPLTPRGRAEAEAAAGAFAAAPDLIVASAFVRARETALPTMARFPDVPCEEWPVEEFTYLGALHGPRTTNAERRPHAEAYWRRADPRYVNGGNGESFQDLIDRARAFLDRLAARPDDGLTAVFTHALFIRAVLWTLTTGITAPDSDAMRAFHRYTGSTIVPNGTIVELRLGGPYGFAVVAGGPVQPSERLAK
ncbi:histidine phosphatase family protein [Actinomadura macrotermitis]|uniref:2,3-bisphosphoglycerate-dependent phosphoglycerate mutase n=1 Tax=Actinomadura macrotermitis TaxID=2585200 RepID=A0A7K0BLH6_9ACTN|nr:histidine phosphatase family protein [Actinomadura macrotermitis]MQY02030.1 2,3-bisphosphoglycerate-dependent phosphoglycerate mutase [Actinomadura macrotermitis]